MKGIYSFTLLFSLFATFISHAAEPQTTPPSPVKVENRLIDLSENQPLMKIARYSSESYSYRATNLTVDPILAELLRLRVSQINHCVYCLYTHQDVVRTMKIPQAKVDTLSAWWANDLFTDAEKAALEYTESLTKQHKNSIAKNFNQVHQQLTKYYTEKQIIDIAGIVINMNIWTRLKMAEGATLKNDSLPKSN